MIQLGRSTPHVFLFQSIVKSRSTVYLTGFPIHTENLAGSPAWNSSPRQPEGSAVRLAVLDVGTPASLDPVEVDGRLPDPGLGHRHRSLPQDGDEPVRWTISRSISGYPKRWARVG